jgi:uncharacterized protein (DUF4415 family)
LRRGKAGSVSDAIQPTGTRVEKVEKVSRSFSTGRPRQRLTIRPDAELVEWFKARGHGYQARINAVLRAYVERARKPTP